MPDGKPAGMRCIQLDADARCAIFTHPDRPAVCAGLQAEAAMCGNTAQQAMVWLTALERATTPG